MKRLKHIFKKGMAFVLSLVIVAGLIPAMSGGANTAQAATGSGTKPSVSAYATKDQLMDDTFKPGVDGTAKNYGKLVFGKNSSGTPQKWYILGQDNGVSGDNTIIFAASKIVDQVFEDATDPVRKDSSLWSDCNYNGERITGVYLNHYGASDLRALLKNMANGSNTTYFTTTEQGLMNPTTVQTEDFGYSKTYTTTDKLYLLSADENNKTIKAGSGDNTVLSIQKSSYWGESTAFWLRLPAVSMGDDRCRWLWVVSGGNFYLTRYSLAYAVQPASNLKLSSVLFASAATAASSGTKSETITDGAAMTLRFDGKDKNIGTVEYSTTTGDIRAVKGSTSQTVALVVQGNDGTKDWYYSKRITGTDVVNASKIASELSLSNINLSACKIWLEITDSTENLTYAVNAAEATLSYITSVAIAGIETPAANAPLDTEASCTTTGVSSTAPQITWKPIDTTAGYNTSYTASVTLTADTFYVFDNAVKATVSGKSAASVKKNADGTLTVTYDFPATAKRKIKGVTAPAVPTNRTFTTYYGYYGYNVSPISGSSSELGTQATVTFEGTAAPPTKSMGVTWTIDNGGGAGYDKTLGAANTFRWTIPASELTNYNASGCPGYDTADGTITGTVTITNKAATSVSITGTDRSISYTGAAIDVSKFFTIDTNAGAAAYSLMDGGTGEGSLAGKTLTVTKIGTFKIKVNTAAKGIYAAGEKVITLTVANGTIQYTATDYSGTYDGQAHSISVNVTNPAGTTIKYSTDGTTYGSANPSFTNAGTYTVRYRITKDNYTTVEASKTVTINKKAVSITAQAQSIIWGNSINQKSYDVSENGIVAGDRIAQITLTPSTTDLTDDGTITISGVKIENAAGVDVTGSYNITTFGGTLRIAHNTALAPQSIDAVKTKTSYISGEKLNVDDITVTAHYADGYSGTVTGFETNAKTIDMSVIGEKTLTVSYTENGGTKTKDITITVSHNTALAPQSIDAVKTKTSYIAGDTLNVDDITVTAHYEDGYSEAVTGFITNAAAIDMSKIGNKTLTVSYTKNGGTKTKNITITVSHNTSLAPECIDAVKTKTFYTAGDTLNVDDIAVTAYYADGHSEAATGFITNAAAIDMSKIGNKTLTISYTKNGGTKTKNITITVSHNTGIAPERIEAVKTKTTYTAGDTLNVDDITVTAHYADGYSEAVTDFTTNEADLDMSKIGDKALTISYTKNGGTKTKDITITVSHNTALAPQSIDAVKTKTSYISGEKLNVDDITVTAHYADGYSEAVTGFTTNAADIDMSKIGDKTLTVSYTKNGGTVTKDITITVSHNTTLPPESIDVVKTKTTYTAGETLNVDDITVTAHYADGYSGTVTGFETNAGTIDMSVIGEKTLTVSYTENSGTKTKDITITVSHNTAFVPQSIDAVKTKTTYTAGETLNVDDITVTAHYADGYIEEVTDYTTNAADIDMSKIGDKELTISYTKNSGKVTKDITITVSHNTALAPDSIDAIKTKTSYIADETLNVDDITVTAHYADGYSEAVTDFTTNEADIDMSKIGDKTLTISYTKNSGKVTKDITITVSHNTTLPPESIDVVKTTTSYTAEEILNVDDITVTAHYKDGYSGTVTGFETNAETIDMSVIGEKTLTVSYTENGGTKTKDITITVSHNTALAPQSIDAVKTKVSYKAGETLNVDDITVTAHYADGYIEEVTDYTTNAADIDMSKSGKKTLTVSYTKNDETKTADITITVNSVYIPMVQKPTFEAGEGVKVTLSANGTVATITVEAGYDLADVVLNGVSKGKVTEVKGLKTGDKLVVTATKKAAEPTEPTTEAILVTLADQKLVARSKLVTMKNGKKAVRITWYNKNGEMMEFDGVQIYRSTKKNSGYGKKPIFTSKTDKYTNTSVKAGTKYYYKVRGFVMIDGQKYYTDYSLKAMRTVK